LAIANSASINIGVQIFEVYFVSYKDSYSQLFWDSIFSLHVSLPVSWVSYR
jgi:hypothetical protein